MLTRYFGFQEEPFGATPDPRFLYSSRTHREALASLHYAFCSNRGFTALIAPPGMGKTTLLFEFLHRIRNVARTAFLFNSRCDPIDLLRNILIEVGVTPQDGLGNMLQQLNTELVETAQVGRSFVVVVDEAQNLSEPALETLRLMTNFETPRAKLMQIVLSGQPQLGELIFRPGLVQLRQRISTFCRLDPFVPEETAAYIHHRLVMAGYKGPDLFTNNALACIAEASEGIPRNINTLCFNALSLSCALNKRRVDLAMLDEVLQDLRPATESPVTEEEKTPAADVNMPPPELRNADRRPSRMRVPALAALLLIVVCGIFWAADVIGSGSRRRGPATQPSQPKPEVRAVAPVLPANPEAKPDAIEVTVDPEQTLSGISVSTVGVFDDEVLQEIEKLNPGLRNPDTIHPGEKLLLPKRRSSASQVRDRE